MRTGEIRSHRLNGLLQFKIKGASRKQLVDKALTLGVSERTAKDYVLSVYALFEEIKKRRV